MIESLKKGISDQSSNIGQGSWCLLHHVTLLEKVINQNSIKESAQGVCLAGVTSCSMILVEDMDIAKESPLAEKCHSELGRLY